MLKIDFRIVAWRVLVGLLCIFWLITAISAQKMKPEEILAKHVESIGTAEAIAAVKTRLFQGKAQARLINSAVDPAAVGKGYIVSSGEKMVIQMNFEMATALDYSREHIGFDGNKINAPFITSSNRSALGSFVFSYKETVKHGLLGV